MKAPILLLMFVAVAVHAAENRPWSLDAGAAFTHFEKQAFDQSSTGPLLRLSYAFNGWLSVEAGYVDLGSVHGSTLPPGEVSIGPSTLTLEPRILTLSPVFTWSPFRRIAVFAKTGYAYSDTYRRFVGGTVTMPDFTLGEHRHDNHFFWAAGIQGTLSDRIALLLDFGRLEFSGVRTDTVTTAVKWRF